MEPNSNMANIFKLSHWEFETIKINMLRALMEKADSMKKQRINVAEKKKRNSKKGSKGSNRYKNTIM